MLASRYAANMETEQQFTKRVRDYLRAEGWRVADVGSNQSDPGWPDLVAVRDDRVVFVELKTDTGHLRERQKHTIAALRRAGQSVWVFRPAEFGQLRATMGRESATTVIRAIAEIVAPICGVEADDIFARSRLSRIATARQIVMYVGRRAGLTSVEIAAALDRDHSTIVYGYQQIAERLDNDVLHQQVIRKAVDSCRALVDSFRD